MSGPTAPSWRAARAGMFAAVVSLLAMMGHAVGGGGLPDPAIVLVPAIAVGGALTSAGTRPRTFGQLFAVLSASQLGFHLLFTVTAHSGADMGMAHLDLPRMVLFHVLAAALSALVMAHGEAALRRLSEAARRLVRMPAAAAGITLEVQWTALTVDAALTGPTCRLPITAPRRGPPRG